MSPYLRRVIPFTISNCLHLCSILCFFFLFVFMIHFKKLLNKMLPMQKLHSWLLITWWHAHNSLNLVQGRVNNGLGYPIKTKVNLLTDLACTASYTSLVMLDSNVYKLYIINWTEKEILSLQVNVDRHVPDDMCVPDDIKHTMWVTWVNQVTRCFPWLHLLSRDVIMG